MLKTVTEFCTAEKVPADLSFSWDFACFRRFSTANLKLSGSYQDAYDKIKSHKSYLAMFDDIQGRYSHVEPFVPLTQRTLFEIFFERMSKA